MPGSVRCRSIEFMDLPRGHLPTFRLNCWAEHIWDLAEPPFICFLACGLKTVLMRKLSECL